MTDEFKDKKLLKNLLKSIKELTELLKKNNFNVSVDSSSIEKVGNKRVQIKHDNAITSPMVGTVYLSPDPKSNAFIKQGQSVKKGDTFFIAPGTVHAIGAGVLLAEIQQTSDITYKSEYPRLLRFFSFS